MDKTMLVEASYHDEVRIAVVNENSELENFEIESKHKSNTKGNIYLAKVLRIEPALQAVFVDYGHTKQGFLSFSNIHPDYYQIPVADRQNAENKKTENDDFANLEQAIQESQQALKALNSDQPANIEDVIPDTDDINSDEDNAEISQETSHEYKKYKVQDVIKPKQMLLVQVEKEERGNKCAALTTYVSLAGRYCILMPNSGNKNAISKKITNQKTRARIKKILDEINAEGNFNVVIRTAGEKKTKTDIKKDYDFLIKTWTEIKDKTIKTVNPALIYKESCLIKRSLRDLYSKDIKEIMVAGEESYKTAKNFMSTLLPSHARRIKLYKDSTPLFTKYGIEKQVDSAYSSRVPLPSGGYIIINPTEALISIDVNSGRSTKERNIEEMAISTNIEAAKEIAKQIMIRNMSGLIVIDFIDMVSHANNLTVEKLLKSYFKHDRAKVQISKMSKLGLMEISRQRLRPSMTETFFSYCPLCDGFGLVNDPSFAALRIIRAINNYVLTKNPKGNITVSLNFEILNYIFNHHKKQLLEIEESFGGIIELRPDASVSCNNYRIDSSSTFDVADKKPEPRNKPKFSKPTKNPNSPQKDYVKNANQKKNHDTTKGYEKKQKNNRNNPKFKNKKTFSIAKPTENLIEEIYDSSKPENLLTQNQDAQVTQDIIKNPSDEQKSSLNNTKKKKKTQQKPNNTKKIKIVDVSEEISSEQNLDTFTTKEQEKTASKVSASSKKKDNNEKKETKKRQPRSKNYTKKSESSDTALKTEEKTGNNEKAETKNTKPLKSRPRKTSKPKPESNTESELSNTKNDSVVNSEVINVTTEEPKTEEKPKKRGWWNKLINK